MAVDALTGRRAAALPLLAALVVALQIGYPLTSGSARDGLTVGIVVTFAATTLVHAVVTRGRRGAAAVVLAATAGFAAEAVGVRGRIPFGRYDYGPTLGVRVLGVPLVVAAAWAMLAWPAALAARRLVVRPAARVAVTAWALAAWDLYLDPQMVRAGAWHWRHPTPHLPGIDDVPLTNYAGWLAVSIVIAAGLQWLLRRDPGGDDRVPLALYLWTWLGSALALAVFLHRPGAAAWGAAGMGLVAVPLLRGLRR
jgi:putative membrane protein